MPQENKINLSIIIPVLNEERYLNKLFLDLKQYFNQEDIEVIVVNDGSDDGSQNLLDKLKLDYTTILMNLKVVEQPTEENKDFVEKKINPKIAGKKMGRNEPCYCGSGKKYKHCCGSL